MKAIVAVINEAIREADAECLPCDRVNLDYDRHREYLDSDEHRAEELFENPPPRASAVPTTHIGPNVPSILCYFLDGSRRTYKIADLLFRGRYLPLIAGRVGVAVVCRNTKLNRLTPMRDFCACRCVLAFPDLIAQQDLDTLSQCIEQETGATFKLLRYTVKADRDPVDLGIARIMSHMADLELDAMHQLSDRRLLTNSSLLVKDGPLRYKNIKGRGFDITQFRNNDQQVQAERGRHCTAQEIPETA